MSNDTGEIEDHQVQPVLDTLRLLTGITIPVQKKTMVLFRLRKRLAQLHHPALPEYIASLNQDKKEQQVFINLLTTNETSFFRTKRIWDFFQDEWLSQFHAKNPSATLKAWSAAASTGEEAASIAMACLDFHLRHPEFRFQILATDVDTDVLAKAESGRFREVSVSRLKETHPIYYQRHFVPAGEGMYQADARVMRNIRFAVHNLMSSPIAFMPQDVVFLRNVLIYFREAEQSHIIQKIGECMNPSSILILGESECLNSCTPLFTFVKPQIYRRNG